MRTSSRLAIAAAAGTVATLALFFAATQFDKLDDAGSASIDSLFFLAFGATTLCSWIGACVALARKNWRTLAVCGTVAG